LSPVLFVMSCRRVLATKAGKASELQARRWNRVIGQLTIDTRRVDRTEFVEKLPDKGTLHGPKFNTPNNHKIAAVLDEPMAKLNPSIAIEASYRRYEEVPSCYFKVTADSMSPETPSDSEDEAAAYPDKFPPLRTLTQRHWQTQEELVSQLLYVTAGINPKGTGVGVYQSGNDLEGDGAADRGSSMKPRRTVDNGNCHTRCLGEDPSTRRNCVPKVEKRSWSTNAHYGSSKPNWIMPEPRRPWQSELPPNWQPLESDERPSLKPDLYSPVKQPLNSFSVSSDIGTGSGCGLCCCCCSSGGGKLGTQPVDVLTTGTERQHCPPASTAAQRLVAHAACCMVTSSSPTEACDVLLIL